MVLTSVLLGTGRSRASGAPGFGPSPNLNVKCTAAPVEVEDGGEDRELSAGEESEDLLSDLDCVAGSEMILYDLF